jgi:2-(1,2-epoxy-1,2-dihydrophenyl)acetyl-CoA isomerase
MVASMSDELLIERDGAVATLTMNRPDSMNSLSLALKNALVQALPEISADDSVRAVVLTGVGRGFCVGQDLREHIALLEAGDPSPLSTVVEHYNPITTALAQMPKPVIAAVNGMAAGAGASLSFACDFRLAAESAKFLLAFANAGLSLDGGASWTLQRLIGSARATAMALLAEPIDAQAAFEMGLVNAVVPDGSLTAAAHELAARLAAGPTVAYANIKRAMAYAGSHTLAESLAFEADMQADSGRTEDHTAAVKAFVTKQKPTFIGR